MKTLYFYGITVLGFQCALMLINPNISVYTNYQFGAVEIIFDLKDRKEVGEALSKTFKTKRFRQTLNP